MCVALYFSVLLLEVAPLFARTDWFSSRWPRLTHLLHQLHRLAPVLAVAGLLLSMMHQSSLGATYGILKARPIWYQPGLAALFLISAVVAGPALTVLASMIASRVSDRARVNDELLESVSRFVGWALVLYLYLRFWDLLSMTYSYLPGRTEALALLTNGQLSFNFWVGEIALGIVVPMVILLSNKLRKQPASRMLALAMVVGGLIAYRWDTNMIGQMVIFAQRPELSAPLYVQYSPALVEIVVGAAVIAYGLLAFSLGVRYLKLVDHPVEEPAPVPAPQLVPATD
jgi:molybdopterin-containing oxidoreductase family membrane subunit